VLTAGRRLWFRALGKLRIYRRLFLLERPLDAPILDLPIPVGLAIARLRTDDLAAYRAFRPDQDRRVLERRWAKGDWCFASWLDGEIVGVVWAAAGRASIDYLDQPLWLDPTEVYTYDLYTAPVARGLGVTRASRAPHLRLLREQGYRRLLGTVSPENDRAWSVQESAGFKRIARIGYVGLGPWRRHFCRPLPRPPDTGAPR
jgi:GNAT superfamily N-acetyltransferase